MVKNDRQLGIILVLISSVCWGLTGTLQALAPDGTPPLTVGSARIVIAATVLFPLCALRNGVGFLRRIRPAALLLGVVGIMGYQFSFFSALRYTGVALGTMIAIGAGPIFAGIVGAVAEGEAISRRWLLSTAVAISGCGILVLGSAQGPLTLHWGGISLAFLAAFCYALMGLGLKRLGSSMNSLEAATSILVTSAIVAIGVLLSLDSSWIFTPRGATIAVTLGVVTKALPLCTFSMGLKKIRMHDAYTLSLAEPLTATILSAVVLGERLTPLSLVGVGLIFLGILLLPSSQGGGASEEHP